MTIIIGGHGLGLQDGSLGLLNRNDLTSNGTLDQRMQAYANVSDGNLVIQERDAFLPSLGEDFQVVRTYNSLGKLSGGADWSWSTSVSLSSHNDKLVGQIGSVEAYLLRYGDGTTLHFDFDAARKLWVATDGAGAYETLQVVKNPPAGQPAFTVTRADQTQLLFDTSSTLTAVVDSNGVRTDFDYQFGRVIRVRDDTGHVLNYQYSGSDLVQIVDEHNGTRVTLVQYGYSAGQLISVTDRFGHVTTYTYVNGLLAAIDLPSSQVVKGQVQTFEPRRISFAYQTLAWKDKSHLTLPLDNGPLIAVSEIVDPLGGKTTFDYDLRFASSMSAADRDARYQLVGSSYFTGGSTRVVDALGNARATSNADEYVAWRQANGFYVTYNAATVAASAVLTLQYNTIRNAQSIVYSCDADGYLTQVVDQQGFQTTYTYGGRSTDPDDVQSVINQDNLLSIVDRNGFTTTFTYDSRGNLLTQTDGLGNQTSYTYKESFNKVASMTSAMGNALASSDEAQYQQKRVELGYAALVAGLTQAQTDALKVLYTTRYSYDDDVKQNLIERKDPGGDVTRFEYDAFGNLTRKIVFLDPSDLVAPAKQQVTQYFYDGFGNNVETVDGEGAHTFRTFDHFGNVLTSIDGRGGVTTNTYDADNRLLSTTDSEGHTTAYAYDAVGNKIRITDANGHTITQVFDRNNMLIATIDPAATAALTRTTTFNYDVLGNRTEVTDAEGRTSSYTFDAARRLVDVATPEVLDANDEPVVYHETYAYDGEGNIVTLTGKNGNVTTYIYTPNGLLKSFTDAVGRVTEYLYDANLQQVQVTVGAQLAPPALRRVLKFAYDEEDQVTKMTDALGNVITHTYDAPGNVVSVTDENGNTTNFEYDRNNRLLKEIRPQVSGQPVRYTVLHQYDANGNEMSTTDENGHTTRFKFDKDDRRVMVTDGNGINTVWSYDARDNVTQVAIGVTATANADGHITISDASSAQVTTYEYNEFNEVVAEVDGVGNALATSNDAIYQRIRQSLKFAANATQLTAAQRDALRGQHTTRYTYDRIGEVLTETDRRANVTSHTYDSLGRLRSQTRTVDNSTLTTRYAYDGNGNMVKTTDALGRSYSYAYDGTDQLIDKKFDSLGIRTHFDYDAFGNRLKSTQAIGTGDERVSQWTYDLNNRITQYTDAQGNTNGYEYDAAGNRLKVIDGKGAATQYVYDALNRNIKVIDPLFFETRYEYDGANNRITVIDPRGGIGRLVYDSGDRYIETIDAIGNSTRFEYDALGNVVTQTTAFGTDQAEVTNFVYDAEGNLRQVTDANLKVSTSDYDANFNLISVEDANGNTTTYGYDALDRLIRITNALGGVKTYSYDLVGNRLTEVNENLKTTTYAYDAENRVLSQIDPLGNRTDYRYDKVGNSIEITRAAGTAKAQAMTFTYDKNNKLIQETNALRQSTTYQYDANNNVSQVTDARGNTTRYAYDVNDRVISITDPLSGVTGYSYDGNGNRIEVIDALLNRTGMGYDANNRLTRTIDALGFMTDFQYDANGNLTRQVKYANAGSPLSSPADQVTHYGYDGLNRLVSTTDALGFAQTLTYDNVDNLLSIQQSLSLTDPSEVATMRHAYDAANRRVATLTAERYLTTYDYDSAGQQIRISSFDDRQAVTGSDGAPTSGTGNNRVVSRAYDPAGRLISQTSPLGIVTDFEYDALGNRTAKVEAAGTASARRSEARYDAANRAFETVDALGTVTRTLRDAAGNAIEVRAAFGTLAERATSYKYDANNRVTQTTDAVGIVARNSYDALGNVLKREYAVGQSDARTEQYGYDAKNQLIEATNAIGALTQYSYDAVGNRTRIVVAPGLPEQRVNSMRYDLDNRLIAEIDGNGVETQYQYDGAGNKVEIIQLARAYDADGKLVTTYQGVPIEDQDRHTLFTYDLDNRILTVVDPLGGETRYEYDALGNQTRIFDANGGVTENAFDAEGRLIRNLVGGGEHGGVLVTNEYDAFANVTRTRRGFADGADTRQIDYAYDELDRQTAITEYDKVAQLTGSMVFSQAFSTVFDYDDFGNQTRLAYGAYLLNPGDPGYDAGKAALAHPLVATLAYDKLDRLVSTTDGVGNTIAYESDSHGNRVSQTTGAGTDDARTVRFLYDQADRLIRRETGDGGLVKLAYDEAGNQVLKETLQRGLENGTDEDAPVWATQTFGYDGNGRVIEETDALGVVTEHVLDAFGNEVETRIDAGTAEERVLKSEYNKNNDLISETDAMLFRSTFQVDKLGNRIAQTDPLGRETRLYYNPRNEQVATLDPEGFLTTFGRDSAGNVTATGVYLNRYTAPADLLVAPAPQTNDPVRVTTYEYDGANNRVRQTAGDGAITEYAYDSARRLVQTTMRGSSDPDLLARTADAALRLQQFEYDAAGRLVEFTNADGTVESYAYDTANNKLQVGVTNPNALPDGRADPARITRFEYDAANRLVRQTFDPDALNLVETLAYDKAGNVVRKADRNGNVTASSYDLGNRLTSVTDALGRTTTLGYDRVGNQTSLTDARGNTTNFEYDKNDRQVKEIQPAVDVFTIAGGRESDVRPTVVRSYDAVGNVVQVIDPSRFKTTSYYDGNNSKIAEINGDNVLRTFAYDATGALTSATLYMTRVAASAHDPSQAPAPPSGDARTIRSSYDAAGRLVRTEYPQIEVTTLSETDTGDPSAAKANATPEELHYYDAFGNRVESTDRIGNRSLAYFDRLGRAVATVDAGGFLTETHYDSQGNLVQQRKYAQALDLEALAAGERPARPAGDVAIIDRIYDAANRLIEEISPDVKIGESAGEDVLERVRTTFAYDANDNQISRTLAAGTTDDEAIEHSYYDAANRRVAVVQAGGTLNTFSYDANGNKTEQTRFIDRVPESVDLATATVADVMAAVTAELAEDETTLYTYDAANRLVSQSDVMIAAGETANAVANDITIETSYDAAGNFTERVDAAGNRSQLAYDALGHITQTLTPNGAASFAEYDAAGMKLRAWTGGLPNQSAQQATNVVASAGGGLTNSWVQPGADSQSWVVWDTAAHDIAEGKAPDDEYPNETGHVGSGPVSVSIAAAAGTAIYFRVVSQDSAGNLAWTEERVATVPPGIEQLSVAQVGEDLQVNVRFNATVEEPLLRFGAASGTLNQSVAFVVQQDGSYTATIADPADAQSLAFRIEWESGGEALSSGTIPFEAGGEHDVVAGIVGIPVPQSGEALVGNGQLVLVDGVRNSTATRVNDQLQFDPQLSTNGTHRYDVLFGTLAGADHSVTLTSHAHQSTVRDGADTVNTDEDGNTTSVVRHMTWQQTYETHVEVTLGAGETPDGAVHAAFKPAGSGIEFSGDVALTLDGGKYSGTLALEPGDYDVKIYYTNAAGREVIVEWRRITVAEAELPADFDVTDDTDEFDFEGQEDELNRTVDVDDPAGVRSFSGRSLEVLASETDGSIERQGASRLEIDAGLYVGPLGAAGSASPITLDPTDSSGAGSRSTDGLQSLTYYTEIRYNALGHKIATNEDSGVWRTFGVDANGNAVMTRLYGTQADEAADLAATAGHEPIVSFAAFDALDRKIATFEAATPVEGASGVQRAVTRTSYDHAGRPVSVLDPGDGEARELRYDGVGNLIASIDPLGNVTRRIYNRRGDVTAEIDPSEHGRTFAYDVDSNLTAETNERTHTITHAYDAFGRRTRSTDPLVDAITMSYDQHDRLVSLTDALGNTTTRHYDKRDNEIWLEDANGHWFGKGYDAMGRLTHEYSFFNKSPTSLTEAQAALDPSNGLHDELIDVATTYDVFGNKTIETDANGRREIFTYGAFGRVTGRSLEDVNFAGSGAAPIKFSSSTGYDRFGGVIAQTSKQGQDIVRRYDAAGRLIEIDDRKTGVKTTYTYHLDGGRATESITVNGTLERDTAYTYDDSNRLVRWEDAVTDEHLNYDFDASGNLVKVFTDDLSLTHTYAYYADGRVATINKGEGLNTFTYDDAGNRVSWDEAGTIHRYQYDDSNRVIAETDDSGDTTLQSWVYDAVGNITQHVEDDVTTTNTFLPNNLIEKTVNGTQTTTTTFDKTGRTLSQTVVSDDQNFTYTFRYNADGTQASVTGQGEGAAGSSFSTYDANQKLVRLDLGQGDNQDSPEFRTFTYNNDGQILSRFHDDGESETANATTQYLYATGNPVAEVDDQGGMELDEGRYDPIKIISGEFPTAAVTDYVVRAGDTLQSIAAQVYGNPSLWFVIADANGLSGAEALREGTHLKIPNTVQNGRITGDTHTLYNDGEIVGSKLPNLKTPPPPQTAQQSAGGDSCAVIGAIILIVLVAIVAIALTIVTAGVFAPAAAALIGATSTAAVAAVTIGITAVAGAVIGFAASAATQGIQVGFGLQEEFDWKQVGIDTAAGFVSGLAGAVGALATAAVKAAQLGVAATRIARVAIIAGEAAAEVGIEAASQAAANEGRIEQPWMLGVAVAGVAVGELLSKGIKAAGARFRGAGDVAQAADADAPTTTPAKNVTLQSSDGSIVTKSVDDVAAKPQDEPTPLKAVDLQLVEGSPGDKTVVKFNDTTQLFAAANKKPAFKPVSWVDTAGAVLTMVQSPSKQNYAPEFKLLKSMNLLNAGQWSNFDKKTLAEFAAGTVGKAVNKKLPIEDAIAIKGPTVEQPHPHPADDLLAPSIIPEPEMPAVKIPEQPNDLDDVLIPSVVSKPDDLSASKPDLSEESSLDDDELADQPVHDPFGGLMPFNLPPRPLFTEPPTVSKIDTRETIKYPDHDIYTRRNPLTGYYEKYLQEAAARTKPLRAQKGLPDYADLSSLDLVQARRDFRAHLGEAAYNRQVKEIVAAQAASPDAFFKSVDPEDLVPLKTYSTDAVPKGGTALDTTGNADYKVINAALRNADATKLPALDAQIRLTTHALEYLPTFQGMTFRGVEHLDLAADLKLYEPGKVVTLNSFTSSSPAANVAVSGKWTPNALYVINSRSGRNINAVALGGEAEVLFPPNTRFKVLRSEPATKQNYGYGGNIEHLIFLDEVPVKTGKSSKWW